MSFSATAAQFSAYRCCPRHWPTAIRTVWRDPTDAKTAEGTHTHTHTLLYLILESLHQQEGVSLSFPQNVPLESKMNTWGCGSGAAPAWGGRGTCRRRRRRGGRSEGTGPFWVWDRRSGPFSAAEGPLCSAGPRLALPLARPANGTNAKGRRGTDWRTVWDWSRTDVYLVDAARSEHDGGQGEQTVTLQQHAADAGLTAGQKDLSRRQTGREHTLGVWNTNTFPTETLYHWSFKCLETDRRTAVLWF